MTCLYLRVSLWHSVRRLTAWDDYDGDAQELLYSKGLFGSVGGGRGAVHVVVD